MRFTEVRDWCAQHGCDRRLATLYARLLLGVDTFESIDATPSFGGTPLLSDQEKAVYRKIFGFSLVN